MAWVSSYLGLPFRENGRDRKGLDCWGLVRLVLNECRGIALPSYGEIEADDLMAVADTMNEACVAPEPWHRVELPREFDVGVCLRRKAPIHVGIVVGTDRFLHIERAISSVCLPLSHQSLARRRMQFFRHKALT